MTRLGLIRRALLSDRLTGARGAPGAVLAVLAPTLLRQAIAPLVVGVPFLTFYPTILVATLFLGWRWATAVAAASALAANFMFQAQSMAFALGRKELFATLGFSMSAALIIWTAESLRRVARELGEANQRQAELNLELQHRVNNNLTIVQALARQTAGGAVDAADFYERFKGRLRALSQANRVLSNADWNAALLPDLAAAALQPFEAAGTITYDGPICRLPNRSCVPLVLALHELATNATKYGALSQAGGTVRLGWTVEGAECRLTWRERGGPPVAAPTRRGLGSRLLTPQAGLDEVELRFEPAGVVCEIRVSGVEAVG